MKDLGVPGNKGRDRKAEPVTETQSVAEVRPDLSGSGLGEAVAPTPKNSANVIRPDDALSELWTPEERSGQGGDLASLATERGYLNNEQLESARRMERQVPGRALSELMVDAGGNQLFLTLQDPVLGGVIDQDLFDFRPTDYE